MSAEYVLSLIQTDPLAGVLRLRDWARAAFNMKNPVVLLNEEKQNVLDLRNPDTQHADRFIHAVLDASACNSEAVLRFLTFILIHAPRDKGFDQYEINQKIWVIRVLLPALKKAVEVENLSVLEEQSQAVHDFFFPHLAPLTIQYGTIHVLGFLSKTIFGPGTPNVNQFQSWLVQNDLGFVIQATPNQDSLPRSTAQPTDMLTHSFDNMTINEATTDTPQVTFLRQHLKTLPLPLSDLHSILGGHAILAGSYLFPWRGCHFEPGDMDIFAVDEPRYNELLHLFQQHQWNIIPNAQAEICYNIAFGRYVGAVLQHPRRPGLNVNLVLYNNVCPDKPLAERIDLGFDLDGCTLKWDGGFLLQQSPWVRVNWKDKVMDYNIEALQARMARMVFPNMEIAAKKLFYRVIDRIFKYKEQRGFRIGNFDVLCDFVKNSPFFRGLEISVQ